MLKLTVFDQKNTQTGTIELPEAIFNVEPKKDVIHAVVRGYLNKKRAGTATTKNRKLVRGGGKKPFRQKGTGQARQGSTRSPLMPGGGVVFAKKPKDWSIGLNKKVRRQALYQMLSSKTKENKITVLDKIAFNEAKTKHALALFKQLGVGDRSVLVVDEVNKNLQLSCRNLPSAKYLRVDSLNVYDLLKFEHLIISKKACDMLSHTKMDK